MSDRLALSLVAAFFLVSLTCADRESLSPLVQTAEAPKLDAPSPSAGAISIEAGLRPLGIVFRWPGLPNAVAYQLYRATLPDTTMLRLATLSALSTRCRDTDVVEGGIYRYQLAAVYDTPRGLVEVRSRLIRVPVRSPTRVIADLSAAYNDRDLARFRDLLADDFQFQHQISENEYRTWGRDKEIQLHERFFAPSGIPPGAELLCLEFADVSFRQFRIDRRNRQSWTIHCSIRLSIVYARTVNPNVEYSGTATFIVAEEQGRWVITSWIDDRLNLEHGS